MPSFAQAVPFLIASVAMTSSITTTTVVCTNDFTFTNRRETRKFSKKNEAPRGCTYHNFAGSSKYLNCQKIETEIKIECGDEDADDTTRMCKVTEHPWNDEQKGEGTDAAAANAAANACVVHGSFHPSTHITTDTATGFCHLKFLPLFDSCDVGANGSPTGVFGMKAEIHNSRNTDNDDNSGMLLRFSHTGGEVYYNGDNPRETVPLHDIIPAERKLDEDDCKSSANKKCEIPSGSTFHGWSCDDYHGNNDHRGCVNKENFFNSTIKFYEQPKSKIYAYETCFGLGDPNDPNGGRCWSIARNVGMWSSWYTCVPKDLIIDGTQKTWYVTAPFPDGSCGSPCNFGFNEWVKDPFHCIHFTHELSPNWCDCGHNKVDSCPDLDVHICASECDNIDKLWCKDDDDSRLCYSVLGRQCYCNDKY